MAEDIKRLEISINRAHLGKLSPLRLCTDRGLQYMITKDDTQVCLERKFYTNENASCWEEQALNLSTRPVWNWA